MSKISSLTRRAVIQALAGSIALPTIRQARGASSLVPIRMSVIGSSGQAELTSAIQHYRLDRKHGLEMQVSDYAVPGQQYTMLRADSTDVAIGNFMDLHRQRKAGVAIKAFHGHQGYNNPVVVKGSSTIARFRDLRGRRIGGFGNTFLDWLVLRAAGKKAHGLDVETDATAITAAPPLLNQLLSRGEIDAAIQFTSLTIAAVRSGEQRVVSDLPTLLREAGLSTEAFYTLWFVSEAWLRRNESALSQVYAMFAEAYERLATDEAIWPDLGSRIRMTDPVLLGLYKDKALRIANPPYRAELIAPTQALLHAIVSVVGEQATGFTQIDPNAFVFPAK